jgi:hypothetical protein
MARLVAAVAEMHVGDSDLGESVAAAVAARRGEYSAEDLATIGSALAMMGCSLQV